MKTQIIQLYTLYFGINKSPIKTLMLEKILARVVMPPIRHTGDISPALKPLHWLSVDCHSGFQEFWKAKLGICQTWSVDRDLPTQSNTLSLQAFAVPDIKSNTGRKSFSSAVPTVNNSLPLGVRSATSLHIFYMGLQHHLFHPSLYCFFSTN